MNEKGKVFSIDSWTNKKHEAKINSNIAFDLMIIEFQSKYSIDFQFVDKSADETIET